MINGQHHFLTNVTRYPELQEVWDMNRNVVAVGSACVRGPFPWEQVLFGADGTMDWFTPTERGLDAGAGTNAVTETRYYAQLSTAAQFNTNDWRWLGPVSSYNSPAIGLLVNDAGMIAGYGAVQTGDPILDALRPTHTFRAPAAGEFNGSDIILTNDLGVLTNGLHSFPRAMNQAGEVVGYSDYNVAKAGLAMLNPTNFHAVFWALTNQAPDDLHSLQQATTNDPLSGFSDAYAINDQSQIVGTSWRNCYTALRTILINVPDGNGGVQTQPVIVQTNVFVLQPGDVVLETNAVSVAALWQRNHNTNSAPFWEITDLNDRLTDPSWQVFNAVGINSNGLMLASAAKTTSNQQNLADAQNAAAENHAVLLVTPQLAVDANRDGTITFDNADQTTAAKPYRFWVNNDHDGYCTVSGETSVQDDLDPSTQTDAQSFSITCTRDLEDFTRLWINTQGITKELQNGTLLLALEWKDAVDDPQMQLFQAAETDGGALYLTDTTIAAQQVASPYGTRLIEWRHLNTLTKYNPFIFPTKFWSNISADQPVAHLLFDAVSRGSGKLVMSFYKSDGVTKIGEGPGVYLELKDIKEMYERWTVGDDNGGTPANRATISALRLPAGVNPFRYDSHSTEANQYILFVHGWNLFPWAKDWFAETAFKRLYWQGYKGRFGVFLWPTTYHPVSDIEIINGISGMVDFDSGEYTAWLSAAPLEILLTSLHQQYSNNVYVFAHSHGNVVVGEALRKAVQDGLGQIVNTYVANQAAIPVHCYDSGQPTPGNFFNSWRVGLYPTGPETPNIYSGWLASNSNAAPTLANFYNANDYALQRNVWETDEALKPWQNLDANAGVTYFYGYLGTKIDDVEDLFYKYPGGTQDPPLFPLHLGDATNVRDRYEIMAFAAEARCRALGTTSINAAGFTSQSLWTMWPTDPFDGHNYHTHPWHSAEFRFTNMDQKNYWHSLLDQFHLLPSPQNP